MGQAEEQIRRIQQKAQQLLKQHLALQSRHHELEQQLTTLKKQRDQHLQTIEELQQKLEVLKLAKSDLPDDEKKMLEKKINQYIKEIDRCITLLSE